MTRGLARSSQALLYALFALVLGVFSHWPAYRHLQPGEALLKLSLVHAGQHVAPCKRLSQEELAKLPPNMRNPLQCPRERVPVVVEVDLDGRTVVRERVPPSGLSRDGASAIYRRLVVSAGEHRIAVRLKDSPGSGGFDHRHEATVTLKPAQVLVIDFDPEHQGITLQ